MRITVKKVFLVFHFDKQEKWLNEMSAKGYALVSARGFTYVFEECEPGEYEIRMQLLKYMPSHYESTDYIRFVEQTGAEYLGSFTRWVYFRKKKKLGPFNLLSDYPSKIKHLNLLISLFSILLCSSVLNAISVTISYFTTVDRSGWAIIPLLTYLISLLMIYGIIVLCIKKRRLKKESRLFE